MSDISKEPSNNESPPQRKSKEQEIRRIRREDMDPMTEKEEKFHAGPYMEELYELLWWRLGQLTTLEHDQWLMKEPWVADEYSAIHEAATRLAPNDNDVRRNIEWDALIIQQQRRHRIGNLLLGLSGLPGCTQEDDDLNDEQEKVVARAALSWLFEQIDDEEEVNSVGEVKNRKEAAKLLDLMNFIDLRAEDALVYVHEHMYNGEISRAMSLRPKHTCQSSYFIMPWVSPFTKVSKTAPVSEEATLKPKVRKRALLVYITEGRIDHGGPDEVLTWFDRRTRSIVRKGLVRLEAELRAPGELCERFSRENVQEVAVELREKLDQERVKVLDTSLPDWFSGVKIFDMGYGEEVQEETEVDEE